VHFLSSLGWLLLIPVTGFPILGWFALSAFIALYPAVWTWLVNGWGKRTRKPEHDTWSRRTLWSLGGAAVWVALEMVRVRLLGGFPWNPLGASQYELIPLIQIASVTGVYGISFLVVWLSLSLFSAGRMMFRRPAFRYAWQAEISLPLAVVALLFAVGFARLKTPDASAATLRVTLVQPSIPQALIWDPNENSNRFQQLLDLSERALAPALTNLLGAPASRRPVESQNPELAGETPALPETTPRSGERGASGTDLLIWPEAAVPEANAASFIAITNLIRTHHVWLIFSADSVEWRPDAKTRDDYDVFNAAFLFDPDGHFKSVYHKQKLVIFGEYIPLVRWLPFIKWFTPITGSFAAGTHAVPFEMDIHPERRPPVRLDTKTAQRAETMPGAPDRVKTSTLICFEDVFPELAREYVAEDTDFLVNLTNDGWFGEGAAQWQQAAAAIFRAVENGVPLVRCSNNGLTCWADANGRLHDIFRDGAGSVYGPGATTVEIPVGEKRERTFYNRHGDWFGWACVGITGIWLVARFSGQRRKTT
jgi:apolipoprotein N-acyltransferase